MTQPKINLTELRERVKRAANEREDWQPGIDYPEGILGAHTDELLALIDTAEAAIEFEREAFNAAKEVYKKHRIHSLPDGARLRETLDRYTTQ